MRNATFVFGMGVNYQCEGYTSIHIHIKFIKRVGEKR